MGRIQSNITTKQIKVIKKSPSFASFNLALSPPYQIPLSPNLLAIALAATRKITQIIDWKSPIAAVKENWYDKIPTR
jgi:hypothetical protein